MFKNEYSDKPLLEKLIILRDGLIKNGENNEYTDLLTKWIDNIDDPNIAKEMDEALYYKVDPRFDLYDTSPMFSYLDNYWFSGEQKKKNLDFFLPKKDPKNEMKKKYVNIVDSAKKCLELIGQDEAEFKKESTLLATNLKWFYDNMIRHPSADRQIAANFYRLSLHVDNVDGLKDIIDFFNESLNEKILDYVSTFGDSFIIQPSWSHLSGIVFSISQRRN